MNWVYNFALRALDFLSRNFGGQSGPTLYIFVVPGVPGPYRGPGPEASASPASWMIRPCRTGLTVRGDTNVRRGPFSHTRSKDFFGVHFSSPKKLTTFLDVLTSRPTPSVCLTFLRRNSVVKIEKIAVGRGPRGGGGPSHGTTGTMVNPAMTMRNAVTPSPAAG